MFNAEWRCLFSNTFVFSRSSTSLHHAERHALVPSEMNAIVFYEEKSGSTALMLALHRVAGIEVVGMKKEGGEPFDMHQSGRRLGTRKVGQLITAAYSATRDGIRIAKMRPRSQKRLLLPDVIHERLLIRTLKQGQIQPIILLRTDLFELALSKFHGNGSGHNGHMQFIAIQDKDFSPERMVVGGKRWVWSQRRAIVHFRRLTRMSRRCASTGLNPVILTYEQMLNHPESFWQELAKALEIPAQAQRMREAFQQQQMRKVRGKSSELYDNYEELLHRHEGLNFSRLNPRDLVFNKAIDRHLLFAGLQLRLQEWLTKP